MPTASSNVRVRERSGNICWHRVLLSLGPSAEVERPICCLAQTPQPFGNVVSFAKASAQGKLNETARLHRTCSRRLVKNASAATNNASAMPFNDLGKGQKSKSPSVLALTTLSLQPDRLRRRVQLSDLGFQVWRVRIVSGDWKRRDAAKSTRMTQKIDIGQRANLAGGTY